VRPCAASISTVLCFQIFPSSRLNGSRRYSCLSTNGEEIGRIRGYPGEDHFWGLLSVLIKKLDAAATREPGQEKSLRPDG
jgi:hypothetical protein